MKRFIEDHITWKKLAPHDRGEFLLNVEHASVIRETQKLNLDLSLNFIIPHDDLKSVTEDFRREIDGLTGVSYRFRYDEPVLTEEEIVSLYVPYMIDAMSDLGSLRHTTDTANLLFDGNQVIIHALGEETVRSLNRTAAPAMSRMLAHDFGMQRVFVFRNKDEKYEEKIREMRSQTEKELKRVNAETDRAAAMVAQAAKTAGSISGAANGGTASGAAAGNGAASFFRVDSAGGRGAVSGQGKTARRRGYEGPVRGNLIVGKSIGGEATAIKDLTRDSGNVIIEGSVFRTDSRSIKNNRCIASIYMTDNTDSVCVKMFISPQKQADFDEHIRTGSYIRVQGNCEYDNFEKMVVVMGQSIEKAEKKVRCDNAPRKRIELHAHTKMSQIDGVMDVADLIETAKAWGHPAVAITDHGVVQAFPDAVAKAKGIKVIYGVEGYLVEDIPLTDGKLDYRTNPARHIILLAKDQTGLKNLYKLVSYSYIDYHYKRPRMPRSEIIRHREGLIIGSACEAGEFFRAVTEGRPDEELVKIAEFYDYLEIQPRENNRFMLRKGMVQSEEELLDFNRKVVEIGKMTGKPVVATCDAHYLNKEDYIYRNIIMAGHGFKELDEEGTLYLKTTEEMLREFAYLGEEEAQRVVIDNPQKIADMIGDVHPISDEKCPPKIEGSEERLRTRCYNKAHEIYGDPLPKIVEQRLERELSSIIGNGYAVMYVAAEMLVQKSLSDGYLVGSRGSVGSSFAATMDGITEVNPLPPHYICPNPECKHKHAI